MAAWPRSALIGGIAAGATVLGAGAAAIWWTGTADSSLCPRALARAAPSTIDDASRLIAVCSAEDFRRRLLTASLPEVVGYRTTELPPAGWLDYCARNRTIDAGCPAAP